MAKITSEVTDITYTVTLSAYEAMLIMGLLDAVCGSATQTYRRDIGPLCKTFAQATPKIESRVIVEKPSISLRRLPEYE